MSKILINRILPGLAIIVLLMKPSFGGECLQSRQRMLDNYKESIARISEDTNRTNYSLGPWIEKCWYHWDPKYPNGELNDELGELISTILKDSTLPEGVKVDSLNLARRAAPKNLLPDMVRLFKEDYQRDLVYDAILEIWKSNHENDQYVENFNYIELFKSHFPAGFEPPFQDRQYAYMDRLRTQTDYWVCSLYSAMGSVYEFNYPQTKKILKENDLFYPYPKAQCAFGYIFSDPRAYEDANYASVNNNESRFFFSLLKHLELEFKVEWLEKLPPHQLKLLRNSIFASYGWEFSDPKLKNWFASYLPRVCRSGVCGQIKEKFDKALLTKTDKKNISSIRKLEK